LPPGLSATASYLSSLLCFVRAQASIRQLPHQSLVHHWHVWLQAKNIVSKLNFADGLTLSIAHRNLHHIFS
jgi:hypothetical protein